MFHHQNDFLLKVYLVIHEKHRKQIFRCFHQHHLNKRSFIFFFFIVCVLFFYDLFIILFLLLCLLMSNICYNLFFFCFLLIYLAFVLSLVIIQHRQLQLIMYQLYLTMQENFHLLLMFSDKIIQTQRLSEFLFCFCLYFCRTVCKKEKK